MKNIIIVALGIFVAITNCGRPKPCIESAYSFSIDSQINPDIDSIRVGDTVFLLSTFPVKLSDQSTGRTIDYSNSTDIGSTLGVVKLVSGVFPGQDAVNEFNYISITGEIYNDNNIPSPNKFQQLKYQQVGDFYDLKIGLIPKEKGTYYLGIGDGLSNGRNKSKSCEKAGFSITLTKTNPHFNYFSDWNSNVMLSSYERPRAYFLKIN